MNQRITTIIRYVTSAIIMILSIVLLVYALRDYAELTSSAYHDESLEIPHIISAIFAGAIFIEAIIVIAVNYVKENGMVNKSVYNAYYYLLAIPIMSYGFLSSYHLEINFLLDSLFPIFFLIPPLLCSMNLIPYKNENIKMIVYIISAIIFITLILFISTSDDSPLSKPTTICRVAISVVVAIGSLSTYECGYYSKKEIAIKEKQKAEKDKEKEEFEKIEVEASISAKEKEDQINKQLDDLRKEFLSNKISTKEYEKRRDEILDDLY